MASVQDWHHPPSTHNFQPTFPFSALEVSWDIYVKTRKRTIDRWIWFEEAEKNDKIRSTTLGTLGYLPMELRRQILMELNPQPFNDAKKPDLSGWTYEIILDFGTDQIWMFERCMGAAFARDCISRPVKIAIQGGCSTHKAVCDIRQAEETLRTAGKLNMQGGCCTHKTVCDLRQASETLRNEFDDTFFSTRAIFFDSPEMFKQFFTSRIIRQAQERSRMSIWIVIELECPRHGNQPPWPQALRKWFAALDLLPVDLRALIIEVRFYSCLSSTYDLHNGIVDDILLILKKARTEGAVTKTKIDLTYGECAFGAPWNQQADQAALAELVDRVRELLGNSEHFIRKPKETYILNGYTR